MNRFLDWFNSDTHNGYIKSAIAHLWFVCIHPFDDGNGRIGRAIADMALSQAENSGMRFFSISHQINRDKNSITRYWRKRKKGIVILQNGLSGILTACFVPSGSQMKACRKFLTRLYSGKTMLKPSCPGGSAKLNRGPRCLLRNPLQ